MKTPQLGSALSPIPGTGSTVTSDPTITGIPGDPSNVDAALAAMQAEIDAIVTPPPFDDFLLNTGGEQALLVTESTAGSTYAIDCSLGNTFDITLTANCTLSIVNPPPSGVDAHIVIVLRQGGAGSYTVTWPGSVDWQDTDGTTGGSAPTLWTAVGAQDDIELSTVDGGTTWGGDFRQHGSGLSPASTVTDETTFGITPAVGSDLEYARQDHTHGSPANPVSSATIEPFIPPAHVHVDNVLFSGDGSSTIFTLPVSPVDAYSISVYVTGSRSQDWTLSGALLDTLTFGSAPASATDNIAVDIAAVLL